MIDTPASEWDSEECNSSYDEEDGESCITVDVTGRNE